MILDTSFLIDLEGGVEAAVQKAIELESQDIQTKVPLVVVYELYISVGKGDNTESNREQVENTLNDLPIIDISQEICEKAGELEGQTQRQDHNDSGVGAVDAILAAISIINSEPILTDDSGDFDRIPANVTVETF